MMCIAAIGGSLTTRRLEVGPVEVGSASDGGAARRLLQPSASTTVPGSGLKTGSVLKQSLSFFVRLGLKRAFLLDTPSDFEERKNDHRRFLQRVRQVNLVVTLITRYILPAVG